MPGLSYQAVVLAGGEDKVLHPLTSGGAPKALLPVANRPLLSYPLRMLQEAGLRRIIVVVSGEKAASAVSTWISQEYHGTNMQCEVVPVAEEMGTADALRAVSGRISAQTFVVVSGDLLTAQSVHALVTSHQLHAATATVLLAQRKISPTADTKPGKAPKNVDYVGLDPARNHLLFYASSPDTLRDLKVPAATLRRAGAMTINSDLLDAHLYVFSRAVLKVLADNPKLSSLRSDMLPFLTQQQFKQSAPLRAVSTGGADEVGQSPEPVPGAHYMEMSHAATAGGPDGSLRVQLVPDGTYCARVHDVQAYAEVNREVADPHVAMPLSGLKPSSRHDNIVALSTTLGTKTTVAAGCIVGENCVLAEKSSVKRSVLGNNCKLGISVKVINSVLMDGVVVGDNAHIQNSVLCAGAQVQGGATLKDCQVGPGFVVSGGVEYKTEVLVSANKATR